MTKPLLTLRQQIIQLLEEKEWSARDLAAHLQVPVRDIQRHLAHVLKTVAHQSGKRFLMHPSVCLGCGWVFGTRSRLNPPSRYPKCGVSLSFPHDFMSYEQEKIVTLRENQRYRLLKPKGDESEGLSAYAKNE